jgi:hypothetical protein
MENNFSCSRRAFSVSLTHTSGEKCNTKSDFISALLVIIGKEKMLLAPVIGVVFSLIGELINP